MLVCAPTGAGKTNCAMLTLLHLIGQHVDEAGVLQRSALKAVYVAPMKALAQEVVTTFSKRLAPLSLVVRELTGDMQLTRAEVDAAHLIVVRVTPLSRADCFRHDSAAMPPPYHRIAAAAVVAAVVAAAATVNVTAPSF